MAVGRQLLGRADCFSRPSAAVGRVGCSILVALAATFGPLTYFKSNGPPIPPAPRLPEHAAFLLAFERHAGERPGSCGLQLRALMAFSVVVALKQSHQ